MFYLLLLIVVTAASILGYWLYESHTDEIADYDLDMHRFMAKRDRRRYSDGFSYSEWRHGDLTIARTEGEMPEGSAFSGVINDLSLFDKDGRLVDRRGLWTYLVATNAGAVAVFLIVYFHDFWR